MKKNGKRMTALLLATAIAIPGVLSGCGSSKQPQSDSQAAGTTEAGSSQENKQETSQGTAAAQESEINKPEKITIMVDGTFQATKEEGQAEWIQKWEELTGIELKVIQPDHSSYYDVLGQTFASGPENWPDVVILSSSYYSGYAAEGALWDMTDAWKNSTMYQDPDTKKEVVESNLLDGHLYGLSLGGGGGCVTYLRQAWLDKLGLSIPTTYDEYVQVLDAFTNGDPDGDGERNTYGTSAAGFIGLEAPYTNYLPEFYQDAFPSFYQTEDGTWVDGFTEDAMKAAIARLQDAYKNGYIDPESLTNATSNCRTKFAEGQFGAFTYWAGGWGDSLHEMIDSNGGDGELVAIPPIEEVDKYWQRTSPVYAITSSCKNPEGVFQYFLESIFDDGDMQRLWIYGVEDVHWSEKAETVCGNTYSEGQFHMKEKRATTGTQWGTVITGQSGSILPMKHDPGADIVKPEEKESNEIFNANNKMAPLPVTTEEMSQYNGDLTTLKNSIIADCVVQGIPVEEGYARFEKEGGKKWSEAIIDSLNNK